MKNFVLGMSCLLMFAFATTAQTQQDFLHGDIIVKLEKDASIRSVQAQLAAETGAGLIKVRELSRLSNIWLVSYDYSDSNEYTMLEKVQDWQGVQAAQFNHVVQERATLPNDPGIAQQWHHVEASDNDIDTDLAWDITTGGTTSNGDEIVVCVLEGANYNHVDLVANHWVNESEISGNGIDDDNNGYVDDYNGWNPPSNNDNVGTGNHGTAVSGMIGAKGDNNNGGAGVNWDVKIMNVVVGGLTEANVIAAYSYPQEMRNLYNTTNGAQGAFVVATNASWGIDQANPANYPVWCAYYDDMGAVGVLNCGATTNSALNVDVTGDMPTACDSDYMISVTATNNADVRTFSGYGATTIDLAAPGEDVYLPTGSTGYATTSGTSFASPCTAGAIALIYSAPCPDLAALALGNPQEAANLVRGYLLDGVDPVANLTNECVTGGRLNVKNSIDLALLGCGPLPECTPTNLALVSECIYNATSGTVETTVLATFTNSESFCEVKDICYTPAGGAQVCIDLTGQGYQSGDTYTITGLAPNTTYSVYFNTEDGALTTPVSVATGDCGALIPGCTDDTALNYDAAATIDDGSCSFPCGTVSLTVSTDCWGAETSWSIVDANGTEVAASAPGAYGNQQDFVWSECLTAGCYTFNIADSYGDGLNGTAFGCAVDGNYVMTDTDGAVLFQMGVADFGTGTSHEFCVEGPVVGCTDDTACNYDADAIADDGSCVEATEYYADADNDGFGDPATTTTSCTGIPTGYVANAMDCVDTDDTIYEGAPGTGAGADNNCDGEVTGDESATGCPGGCVGDLDNNCMVNVPDLLVMVSNLGCAGQNCGMADMNGDNSVSTADLLTLVSVLGTNCE